MKPSYRSISDEPSGLRKILEFRLRKGLLLFNNILDYCISEDEIASILQTEYLRNIMFTTWFDSGQKLKKNDMKNILIVYELLILP